MRPGRRPGAPRTSPTSDTGAWPAAARWWAQVLGVAAVAVAVRTAYVVVVLDATPLGLDAVTYVLQGGGIRTGAGYATPASLFTGRPQATAGFPPLYATYQAGWQAVVGTGDTAVRLAGLVPGAATVGLTAALARRVLGDRGGLVVAALVALSPTLVAVDGSTMSESLTVPLVTAVVLLAHRAATDDARVAEPLLIGALCGLAALTRQDLLLLLPLAAVPAAVFGRGRPPLGVGLARGAVVVVAATAVVAPWAWRNHGALGSTTISTLSPSSATAGGNCDETYRGPAMGSWSFACVAAATPDGVPEAEVAAAQREAAVDHARTHLARVPLVVAAREARVWSFWDWRDLARRDAEETRRYGWQLVARPLDAGLAVVGGLGLVARFRRRRDLAAAVLLAPGVLVTASAAAAYGNPRFAAIAHPVLLVGVAAVAARVAAARSWSGRPNGPPVAPAGAD